MRRFSFEIAPAYAGHSDNVPFWDEFVSRLNEALAPAEPDLRTLIFKRAEVRHARRRPSSYRF